MCGEPVVSEAGRLITSRQLLRQLRRFGQRLSEGEVCLETACGQIALVMKLARIGNPFIDQDQARSILVEQFAQNVAGAGGLFVVGLDTR